MFKLTARMQTHRPMENAQSSVEGLNVEILDVKRALGLIMEDISQEREVPEKSLQILGNLKLIQSAQMQLHEKLLSVFEDLAADKETYNGCILMLDEELKTLHADAKVSQYMTRVQAGIRRFCILVARDLGLTWTNLAERLFLESNKDQRIMYAAVQKALEGKGVSHLVWEDCQAVAKFHSLSHSQSCEVEQKTTNIRAMVSDEVCPQEIDQYRDSVLTALDYVIEEGY